MHSAANKSRPSSSPGPHQRQPKPQRLGGLGERLQCRVAADAKAFGDGLAAIKARAAGEGIPYQRYIRRALEQALDGKRLK